MKKNDQKNSETTSKLDDYEQRKNSLYRLDNSVVNPKEFYVDLENHNT